MVALHGGVLWALLQVPAMRQAVLEHAPIFVNLIPSDAPAPPPPAAPPRQMAPPRPAPLIVSKAAPASATSFVIEPPPVQLPPVPAPIVQVEVPPAPPAPLPPPAPAATPAKVIPASGVQYLVPPPLEYPRASRRLGETGKALVRVYIDEEGLPRNVQLNLSSGHTRLDDAAVAAVQKARFKPHTENGRPTAGWAFIPLNFELEK